MHESNNAHTDRPADAGVTSVARSTDLLSSRLGRNGILSYRLRLAVQIGFTILILAIGAQFARFVLAGEAGETPLPHRPPGVEGFLPISGLMGALDWIYQGTLNTIHPAATVLLLLFTAGALLLRKNFCSWFCPIGFLSESLARLGRRLFGRNFRFWKWLDILFRALKYLILGFFAWAIGGMTAEALQEFIYGEYNRVGDVKMYFFFAELSTFSVVVLLVLAVGSILVNGFWCRYLCPYGAWLGLFSWLSPLKIRRDGDSCTDCGSCDTVCMARLPVSKKATITSVECTGCLDCVASCPVQSTLYVGTPRSKWTVGRYAAAVVLLFVAGYGLARGAGAWENAVTDEEYIHLIEIRDELDHLGE
jgi:polyferredoxin